MSTISTSTWSIWKLVSESWIVWNVYYLPLHDLSGSWYQRAGWCKMSTIPLHDLSGSWYQRAGWCEMSTTYLYMIYLEAGIRELDIVWNVYYSITYLYMIYLEAGIGELDSVKCLNVSAAGPAIQVSIQLQAKVSWKPKSFIIFTIVKINWKEKQFGHFRICIAFMHPDSSSPNRK